MSVSITDMSGQPEAVWNDFDPRELCCAGAILWLWEESWLAPRLAVADDDDGGAWHYESGGKVGVGGELYMAHKHIEKDPAENIGRRPPEKHFP